MNSIKRHLSLIIPLMMLLCSFESSQLIQRAVAEHEKKLSQDYSIVIASTKEMNLGTLQEKLKEVIEVIPIDSDIVMKELQGSMSDENLEFLKKQLPLFYSIKLSIFPTERQITTFNQALLKIDGVQKAELFVKTHTKVYKLLLLLKKSILFFGSLLGILSILLMVKQIEIWNLQHSKRMEIMSYLGAPSWMKNKVLFKLASIDSLIASVLVIVGLMFFLESEELKPLFVSLEIENVIFTPVQDFAMLLVISLAISYLSAIVVIARQKDY
ncbi:cell division protein FtsX [Helicobacter enhydrae]|uniref:Cell division protein FtsX n=1 Tax=Helicobacter enhydrae TaxID=222136 RepID=A0A1B1U4B1_9HELI|nr:FtsX-like permease family protein [Helicobacter enhydrae]ANV97581.1 cell division protein FtsX [Helicobacter enhydrae]